jgi:hypothetical protein
MPPAEPYGSGGLLVFDTSAWNRQRHYDHHFDPLCRVLGIESVWVADPGSID